MNNLGGFKLGPVSTAAVNGHMLTNQTNGFKFPSMASAFESTIDGIVKSNGVNGMHNGLSNSQDFTPVAPVPTKPVLYQAGDYDDEISDVFSGLSMTDTLIAAPGYGRVRSRRSSAPVNTNNGLNIWDEPQPHENGDIFSPKAFSSTTLASFAGWNGTTTFSQSTQGSSASSIWSNGSNTYGCQGTGSRPSSQTSSYSSDSTGFSPVYSPTMTNGLSDMTLLTTVPNTDDQLKMVSAFKVGICVCVCTCFPKVQFPSKVTIFIPLDNYLCECRKPHLPWENRGRNNQSDLENNSSLRVPVF